MEPQYVLTGDQKKIRFRRLRQKQRIAENEQRQKKQRISRLEETTSLSQVSERCGNNEDRNIESTFSMLPATSTENMDNTFCSKYITSARYNAILI